MIIPKRDAKCYGAVHIDNYLTFTGFCKKVDSDELYEVDVFIDGTKIDTLKADKKIVKVEEIYDIEGHGFLFEVEEKYFDKSHSLEFKASSGEELVNGKIQTIDKKHPKFNEYKFLHSLNNVDEEAIPNLYCKDAIGFLAVEENLNNDDFRDALHKVFVKFFDKNFKLFYFNVLDYKLARDFVDTLKVNEKQRIELIQINSLMDITRNVEVFINQVNSRFNIVNRHILLTSSTVFPIHYISSFKNKQVKDLNNVEVDIYFDLIKIIEHLGYRISTDDSCNFRKMLINTVCQNIDNKCSLINDDAMYVEGLFLDSIKFALENQEYIKMYNEILRSKLCQTE